LCLGATLCGILRQVDVPVVFSNAKQPTKQEKTSDLMPVISTLQKQLSVIPVQDTSVVRIG